ncbi:SDR family NAD(P)-dependent oxidoreductase [Spiribacter sp. 2438]|uniref:SDR family NAD(P)-dependent oxidoreductase n=1 Tax=Spiribacter sp. 2438 TaxID=2666185 RepID=UPI0012AF6B8B|nr:SDR family NAD(P)-dependent oxidoreductase [Spiribacter sp. 2438]QGM21585.1 SDR family NAD(P)-dependent oxidoreductase [Spiribacter sp. 2438]
MSTGLVVITGASSGIGRAMAQRMASQGQTVVAIGRRAVPLEALAASAPDIEACVADVATEGGQAAIVAAVSQRPVRWLIHNAGVLEPVGPLLSQDAAAIRGSLAINLEAPIALTRQLLPVMESGGRILHVSSGAAHRALAGWGAYCISKAGLYMAYEVLRQELDGTGVAIGTLRPGVVDTPMQTLIREQSIEDFPAVERFRALKSAGELSDPVDVAAFMEQVLSLSDTEHFSRGEWDIREHYPLNG